MIVDWTVPDRCVISDKSGRLKYGQEPLVVDGVEHEPLLSVKKPGHLRKARRLK